MRILIADDHPIVRHGLKQMLAADPSAPIDHTSSPGSGGIDVAAGISGDAIKRGRHSTDGSDRAAVCSPVASVRGPPAGNRLD